MDEIIPINIKRESMISLDLSPSYKLSHIDDIDDDGIVEAIISTKYGIECHKLSDGSLAWRFDIMDGELIATGLRDIDFDGKSEILLLVQSEARWIYIIDPYGNLISSLELGDKDISLGNLSSLKIDGGKILLTISDRNQLIFFTIDGNLLWSFDAQIIHHGLKDYDNDNKHELVLVYRKAEKTYLKLINLDTLTEEYTKEIGIAGERDPYVEEKKLVKDSLLLVFFDNKLRIFRVSDGKRILEKEVDALEIFSGVADFDGDGEKELILATVDEFGFNTSVEVLWPYAEQVAKYTLPIMVNDVRIGDYNKDGKDELALVGFNEVIFLGVEGEEWTIENILGSEIYASHGEDFDRDGIPEVMVLGEKGVAIVDLADKAILWMDKDVVLHEIDYLLGIGDILPIDIDGDDEEEWLLIDDSSESRAKIILLKGVDGTIKELWSRTLKIDYIKDVEILFPENLILLTSKSELVALNKEGFVVWRCRNCPSDYILFADTTGDGSPELILFSRRSGVKVLSSKNGSVLWDYNGNVSSVYLGDVDGDGRYEVIINKSDALQVLDGISGSPVYTILTESRFKRIDVFDVDSDDIDEILIYKKSGLILVRGYNIGWEKYFLDPEKIIEMEPIRYTERKYDAFLLKSSKTLFIIDSYKGLILDKIEGEQFLSPHIIADIDGDEKDELVLIAKNKKELVIMGDKEYKRVRIPKSRNYFIKKLALKRLDMLLLVSGKTLWVLDPKSFDFKIIAELDEKIVEVIKLPTHYVLVGKKANNEGSTLKLYKVQFSLEPSPTIKQLSPIIEFQSTILDPILRHQRLINNILYASKNKLVIVDRRNRKIISFNPKTQLVETIKFDGFAIGNKYGHVSSKIVAWKDNLLYIIDPYKNEFIKIKHSDRILDALIGDIDGDGGEEVVVVDYNYSIALIDPILYRLGCRKIFSLGFIEPIKLSKTADIDGDSAVELVFLKSRGIEAVKFDIFNRRITLEDQLGSDEELRLLKAKILCGKELQKIQSREALLKAKKRVEKWSSSLQTGDTNLKLE